MRRCLVIGLALAALVLPAAAQAPPRAYTLTVTAQDVAMIAQALQARPYAEVAPLLAKLAAEVSAQDAPAPATPAKKP